MVGFGSRRLQKRTPHSPDFRIWFDDANGMRNFGKMWADTGRIVWDGATRVDVEPPATNEKPASPPSPRASRLNSAMRDVDAQYRYKSPYER